MAPKYPKVKFLKSVATKCVENMIDKDLPAIMVYKDGDLINPMMCARGIFGGVRMNVKTVEYVLSM